MAVYTYHLGCDIFSVEEIFSSARFTASIFVFCRVLLRHYYASFWATDPYDLLRLPTLLGTFGVFPYNSALRPFCFKIRLPCIRVARIWMDYAFT